MEKFDKLYKWVVLAFAIIAVISWARLTRYDYQVTPFGRGYLITETDSWTRLTETQVGGMTAEPMWNNFRYSASRYEDEAMQERREQVRKLLEGIKEQ